MGMRVLYVASSVLLAGAAPATFIRLSEDFEGPKFPPEGWVAEGNAGAWTRGWEVGNHFARGYSEIRYGSFSASLLSRHFKLRSTGKYRLYFKYKAGFLGRGAGLCTVALRRGLPVAWERGLLSSGDWSVFDELFDHFPMNEDLFLEFRFAGTAMNAIIWLSVDDVVLRECVLPVEPISLGRVRALYR